MAPLVPKPLLEVDKVEGRRKLWAFTWTWGYKGDRDLNLNYVFSPRTVSSLGSFSVSGLQAEKIRKRNLCANSKIARFIWSGIS